jgi:hypothetical protein
MLMYIVAIMDQSDHILLSLTYNLLL